MSAENIDLDSPEEKKEEEESPWSGNWKKINSLEKMIFQSNFWTVKDSIF